ncbi:hypothetical protein ElP_14190 [Tautonia plasticadhaerens]|uniref:Uncharacterized protein n=1 Tax=Tautonia plasticadhaerens TaxID=2527974 RepID=A0A518GY69_9BACT|nr:hypothetical protein ElP_14190 [Tautonia plasticadhaerens]
MTAGSPGTPPGTRPRSPTARVIGGGSPGLELQRPFRHDGRVRPAARPGSGHLRLLQRRPRRPRAHPADRLGQLRGRHELARQAAGRRGPGRLFLTRRRPARDPQRGVDLPAVRVRRRRHAVRRVDHRPVQSLLAPPGRADRRRPPASLADPRIPRRIPPGPPGHHRTRPRARRIDPAVPGDPEPGPQPRRPALGLLVRRPDTRRGSEQLRRPGDQRGRGPFLVRRGGRHRSRRRGPRPRVRPATLARPRGSSLGILGPGRRPLRDGRGSGRS